MVANYLFFDITLSVVSNFLKFIFLLQDLCHLCFDIFSDIQGKDLLCHYKYLVYNPN